MTKSGGNPEQSSTGGLIPYSPFRAHLVGNRQRLVGAVEKLDGAEDQLAVADVLEIVHLGVAGRMGLVPGLAGRIGVLDRAAVVHMGAGAPGGQHRPEIVEHVAVEAQPLARLEPDVPDPYPVALGDQPLTDATVGARPLALELGGDLGRPGGAHGLYRLLVQCGHGHGVSP